MKGMLLGVDKGAELTDTQHHRQSEDSGWAGAVGEHHLDDVIT